MAENSKWLGEFTVTASLSTTPAIDVESVRGARLYFSAAGTYSLYDTPDRKENLANPSQTFYRSHDDSGTAIDIVVSGTDESHELPTTMYGTKEIKIVKDSGTGVVKVRGF